MNLGVHARTAIVTGSTAGIWLAIAMVQGGKAFG